ncbi:MAG: 50S ribosomal protein L22 [Deltaproteobacteria bacterium]|nr:50S ribosomal protein L22 [Deltaproteobacteria bacterium]
MNRSIDEVECISKATLRNVRVSPQKSRLVVDLIRGKRVQEALEKLRFCDKKSAPLVSKLLLSAVSNVGDDTSVNIDDLYVRYAWVDSGRVLKRSMPRAQGRATPIRKRHSSITVMLSEK